MTANGLAELMALRRYVESLHALPGRLRLRVSRRAVGDPGIERLRCEGLTLRGLKDAAFNPVTGSLLVLYDPAVIAPRDIEAFFAAPDEATAARIAAAFLDM